MMQPFRATALNISYTSSEIITSCLVHKKYFYKFLRFTFLFFPNCLPTFARSFSFATMPKKTMSKAKSAPKKAKQVTKASPSKSGKASKNGRGSRMGDTPKTPKGVSDAMFKFMCDEHSLGMTEWTKMELANVVGYANPRSENCGKGLKVLVNDERLAVKGSKSDTLILTTKGIASKPKESEPKDIHEIHDRFIKGLKHKLKSGKDKVDQLWDILKDREVHDIKDVSEKLGYSNPRSFLNTKIIATMKDMDLAKKDSGKGKIQMTEKPFPSTLA